MSEEEIKKLAKEEFINNVMEQFDSTLIFTYVQKLEFQLQQKENIIKEVINYIKEESWFCYKDNEEVIDRTPVYKLLEILGDNDGNIYDK